jgi:hypothetical protein
MRLNLTQYKTGINGSYPYLDKQLSLLNSILLANPYNESCFKHHWQYHPADCNPQDVVTVLPKVPFLPNSTLNTSTFASFPASCFILSSYDAYYPHFLNVSEFLTLYGNLVGSCNASFSAMRSPICQFFGA